MQSPDLAQDRTVVQLLALLEVEVEVEVDRLVLDLFRQLQVEATAMSERNLEMLAVPLRPLRTQAKVNVD